MSLVGPRALAAHSVAALLVLVAASCAGNSTESGPNSAGSGGVAAAGATAAPTSAGGAAGARNVETGGAQSHEPGNGSSGTSVASAGAAGFESSNGGAPAAGAAGSPSAGVSGADCATANDGCGTVLFIGGDSPMVGVDRQLHETLQAMHLKVEDARESALPNQANGKRLVVLSYSMSSTDFKAEDWAGLSVPIIVLEHYLLPRLGMTKTNDHGFHDAVTQIELISDDPVFTAGLPKGKATVYAQVGEFFWGIPAPSALAIATVVGAPDQVVTFGYTAGSMMAGRTAPARRVQVFVAVHAPPANPTPFLSADGLKLFGAAATWAIN